VIAGKGIPPVALAPGPPGGTIGHMAGTFGRILLGVAAGAVAAGCGDVGLSINTDTGLVGIVLRGPTEPVCRAGDSCTAPFGAGFSVRQGDGVVVTFRSDASGRFEVHLAPGTYLVVPDADAPILSPVSQAKPVVVGAAGLTSVQLVFDTGIR
jgi:hypothetical protein